jgi:transcriptional regulator with XRE-family HTH domain
VLGCFEIACLNQQRVQVAFTWCFNTKRREEKMSQSKKSVETKQKRAKSLTAVDIKKLIQAWPDRTIEELAEMFGVSKATIEKIARNVRMQNPALCLKKAIDLNYKVAQALKLLEAENGNSTGEVGPEILPQKSDEREKGLLN